MPSGWRDAATLWHKSNFRAAAWGHGTPVADGEKQIIQLTMTTKTTQRTEPRLRLNLRQLEVFAATARAGSTHGAAERVARSQSAASAALVALESVLEAALFDRVGRRLVLNENGRALLPATVSLLDQAAQLQGLFAAEHRAPLRLAASFTIGEYLLPERIAQWKALHGSSQVRLMIANTSRVVEAVINSEVDVGFIEGAQTHPDLRVRRWLEDELVIVAAPSHAFIGAAGAPSVAARKAAKLGLRPLVGHKQLATAGWIMRETGSGTRQAADAWLVEHLGPLDVDYELGSTEAIKRMCAAGGGVACLSRHAVALELAQGSLVELRTRLPRAVRRLLIAVRRDKRLGRATQEFVSHCGG